MRRRRFWTRVGQNHAAPPEKYLDQIRVIDPALKWPADLQTSQEGQGVAELLLELAQGGAIARPSQLQRHLEIPHHPTTPEGRPPTDRRDRGVNRAGQIPRFRKNVRSTRMTQAVIRMRTKA
jgi:hypothetical protein